MPERPASPAPSAGPRVRLVLGLGNPGAEYEGTRHNVGFELVERLAARLGKRFVPKGRAVIAGAGGGADGVRWLLAKPQTFMNLSGRAAKELVAAAVEAGEAVELLVACDDFPLPLGRLRCRAGGSDGGQKGLASILATVRATWPEMEVPRLRLGLGEPPSGQPAEDYVLRPFKRAERPEVETMLERAADLVADWLRDGDLPRLIDRANANSGAG